MDEKLTPISDNILLSGGAEGADVMWSMCAGSAGHSVIHWSFAGHRSTAPVQEIVQLKQDQLDLADPFLIIANETMQRSFPTKSQFVNNLLRRNWYQVKDSESVYAISTIKKGKVQGGTAWATTMFCDRYAQKSCKCYVFCQDQNQWFKWEGKDGWMAIFAPPVPRGIWAGIGSRDLRQNGKDAIRSLLSWKKPVD